MLQNKKKKLGFLEKRPQTSHSKTTILAKVQPDSKIFVGRPFDKSLPKLLYVSQIGITDLGAGLGFLQYPAGLQWLLCC